MISKRERCQLIIKGLGLVLYIAIFLFHTTAKAQESVNSSGGNAIGIGGSVSYSIGQIASETHTSVDGSIAQGTQQPYEISVLTAIIESKTINLSMTAYPNPSSDYVTLYIDENDLSNVSYQLFDMHGRLLQNEKITSNQTTITMSELPSATYYLKVLSTTENIDYQTIKIFKIIKN